MDEQRGSKLTNEQRVSNLINEYKANIDLWRHDDDLRQKRNGTFLSICTILLVTLGTLITISPSILTSSVIAVLIAVFGIPICIMWYRIQFRNGEYIRFRRFQMRAIEAQLGNVTTISNQWKALNEHQTLSFDGVQDTFTIKPDAKCSATKIEGSLPMILAVFWLIVFLGGAIFIVLHFLNLI